MTKIDQFESVFNAAAKPIYTYHRVELPKWLVLSDVTGEAHASFRKTTQEFFADIAPEDASWHDLTGDAFGDVQALLDATHDLSPDIICTYRNLHTNTWKWPYSLGDYIDVLTQETNIPVLVLPHPDKNQKKPWPKAPLREVMAITDQLTGDDRLINYAHRFTPPDGTLLVGHVEDNEQFERYIGFISKIPELDTDLAREKIKEVIFKEPHDFLESCRKQLSEQTPELKLQEIITLGHFLTDYQKHIEEHEVDLLVLNTKDDDQLAMNGLAYPLAVEIRSIPLLML